MPNHRLLLAAAASACVAAASAARARDLTVALPAGPFADAVRHLYVAPFVAASGTPVTQLSWTGGLDAVRAHAGAPAPASAVARAPTAPAAPPGPAAAAASGTAGAAPSGASPAGAPASAAPSPAPAATVPATQAASPSPAAPSSGAPSSGAPSSGAPSSGAPSSGAPSSGATAATPATEAEWDLVMVEGDVLTAGCAEGLFQHLDWSRLGGRDHYLPQAASDCGVGAYLHDTVLAWDRDKFPGTPSWGDFWDVAKHPGKRGLQRGPRLTLEIALLADGVAPADVYATLRTDEGVDRAFRKLDQLKPYLVWWDRADQAPQLLASGEVLLTAADNDAIARANAALGHGAATAAPGGPKDAAPATTATPGAPGPVSPGPVSPAPVSLGMSWAGSLQAVASWTLLRGSPQAAAAYALLGAMGDPHREAALEAVLPLGGPAQGAADGLPPDALAASPAAPANLAATLPVDEAFWHDNFDRLDRRYAAWLAR